MGKRHMSALSVKSKGELLLDNLDEAKGPQCVNPEITMVLSRN